MTRTQRWLVALACALLIALVALFPRWHEGASMAATTPGEMMSTAAAEDRTAPAQANVTMVASAEAAAAAEAEPGVRASPAQANLATGVSARSGPRFETLRTTIVNRSATVPAEAKTKAGARMEAVATAVNTHAANHGQQVVAQRLAARFGMTAEALLAEKEALGASWGQLMIAHALAAKSSATVAELIALHDGGMGWGQIAAGLGLKLGSAMRAVNGPAQLAQGRAKVEGRVTSMRGQDARAGVRGGLAGGLAMQHGRAGVSGVSRVGIGLGR